MNTRILYIPLFTLLFQACGGGTSVESEHVQDLVIGANTNTVSPASIYQMPTPNELFSLVEKLGKRDVQVELNPVTNTSKYISMKARAINFGIYATDLIYASYNNRNVEIAKYYMATKQLADGLGLSSAFSEMDFVRLQRNVTRSNTDSLEIISTETYMRGYERLQEVDMASTLALTVAGAWIETMHLVMSHIDQNAPDKQLMARIAEQRSTLENLVQIMEAQSSDAEVAKISARLTLIRDIYDQVNVQRIVREGNSTSGRMILGDEITLDLTLEKYKELQQAIEQLRKELIRTEDQPTPTPAQRS